MDYRLPDLDIPADNPFQNDVLDRRPLVELLAGLIGRLSGPFVLALDSPWGIGKTTLVRMLKAKLEQEHFQCVYFNAWQVDYVTDPLVALVSALDDIHLADGAAESAFRSHLQTSKKITSAVAKRALIAGVKVATLGILDVEEATKAIVSDGAGEMAGNLVDAFQKEKESLERFRREVENAVNQLKAAGKKETLVFFIDELDRCRPTFAIEMLERIKHLFDVPNIVFVLSVDKSQLEASTAAVYGEKINAPEYLRRFIDLEYGVPVVQTKRFTTTLFARFGLDAIFSQRNGSEVRYDKQNFIDFFTALADLFGLSLRARERCVTRLAVVMDQTPSNHYLDSIVVALLVALRSKQPDLFHGLCIGSIAPADAMNSLSRLPGGAKFVAERSSVLIETYLLVGDADSARTEARYTELDALTKDFNADPTDQSRARDLIDMRRHILSGHRFGFSLRNIAAKVDLAALVKD